MLLEPVQDLEHKGVWGGAADSSGDSQAHCTSAERREAFLGHRSAISRERGTDIGARDGHTAWDAECVKDNCCQVIPMAGDKGQELSWAPCSRATCRMSRSHTTSKGSCCSRSATSAREIGILPKAARQRSRGLQPCQNTQPTRDGDGVLHALVELVLSSRHAACMADTTPRVCLGFLLCP